MDIYGRKIDVRKYLDDNDATVLIDSLMVYDPEFSRNYKNKSQQKKMPLVDKLIFGKDHLQETSYSIKFF